MIEIDRQTEKQTDRYVERLTPAQGNHHFCMACVVSVCEVTPPSAEGKCPLCRRAVKLADLKRVDV